ncbi:hypothetical protein H6P81_018466 [Aristolochia fimbriata]|uniref:Uncharacterized protein n=1 Tax=Aristolochia fimbriata TaxID=158543 RepID=A0AAV7E1G9_ARIFI|nr:hypothetical protein H6P81_018466 [Aristolochia fimbriata]
MMLQENEEIKLAKQTIKATLFFQRLEHMPTWVQRLRQGSPAYYQLKTIRDAKRHGDLPVSRLKRQTNDNRELIESAFDIETERTVMMWISPNPVNMSLTFASNEHGHFYFHTSTVISSYQNAEQTFSVEFESELTLFFLLASSRDELHGLGIWSSVRSMIQRVLEESTIETCNYA